MSDPFPSLPVWTLTQRDGNPTGEKPVIPSSPGQWKVLELEFYTSEFCVGVDPEVVESKIYGLPLAMQGVVWKGKVCVVCVFSLRCFFVRYLVCFFGVFVCDPDNLWLGSKPIYIYNRNIRGWQQQKDGVGKRQPKDVYRRKEHSLLRDVSQLFSEQVTWHKHSPEDCRLWFTRKWKRRESFWDQWFLGSIFRSI